jgi:hypothetical protein
MAAQTIAGAVKLCPNNSVQITIKIHYNYLEKTQTIKRPMATIVHSILKVAAAGKGTNGRMTVKPGFYRLTSWVDARCV